MDPNACAGAGYSGECSNGGSGPVCTCLPEWTGDSCEISKGDCYATVQYPVGALNPDSGQEIAFASLGVGACLMGLVVDVGTYRMNGQEFIDAPFEIYIDNNDDETDGYTGSAVTGARWRVKYHKVCEYPTASSTYTGCSTIANADVNVVDNGPAGVSLVIPWENFGFANAPVGQTWRIGARSRNLLSDTRAYLPDTRYTDAVPMAYTIALPGTRRDTGEIMARARGGKKCKEGTCSGRGTCTQDTVLKGDADLDTHTQATLWTALNCHQLVEHVVQSILRQALVVELRSYLFTEIQIANARCASDTTAFEKELGKRLKKVAKVDDQADLWMQAIDCDTKGKCDG
ncbi:hypothetical protein SARC_13246 [Sphaeroforma arctica JP610]|uniref:EGF-like domain-containing protein n=1 Tax=Sphaeroforma arctica JP610 TaxID=667725 RepID=A0A0L0FBS5_9EUKA|nr:hypothetical protein SARC_13246 [Sphaeroforma arctica JP610]KNC74200.1 hypothetical protein SARC_13246 [Sphaeroforma arctica JP610]|eukprot:XP_014148102.1 hypothetical protein SARC_13246 [Sphaeroforma arctica JP610]